MNRIVRKASIVKSKNLTSYSNRNKVNKFYSILKEIENMERKIKTIKYTFLKLYSNQPHQSIDGLIVDLKEKVEEKKKGGIVSPDDARYIIELLLYLEKEIQENPKYELKDESKYSRSSKKDGELINAALQVLEGVEDRFYSFSVRNSKYNRKRYYYNDNSDKIEVSEIIAALSNINKSEEGMTDKEKADLNEALDLIKNRADLIGEKLIGVHNVAERALWSSFVGIIIGITSVVIFGSVFYPVLLFFVLLGALSSLIIIATKSWGANISEKRKEVISSLFSLSRAMVKSQRKSLKEVKKCLNYIKYGIYNEKVDTNESPEVSLSLIQERIEELKTMYLQNKKSPV